MLCIWHLEMCFLIFLNNVNIKNICSCKYSSVLNEMLRNDLYGIAYDDKYYKIIAVEAPINYSRLIDARLYAEQMYIDFRDEAPDFIKYIFTVMILLIQE